VSPTLEQTTRVGVTVTFLRMDAAPGEAGPALPEGVTVERLNFCSVERYRRLYATVGGAHVWWLRRLLSDKELALLLRHPAVSIHVLYVAGVEAGFYELDASHWPAVNLSYFGLMPHAIGAGFGFAFLRHAVDAGFAMGAKAMTVNTCTADHPRALPAYLRAGFRQVRAVREVWDVPVRLGLVIPERLLI
jgi:GNAT superfamily N-acetyltransferase